MLHSLPPQPMYPSSGIHFRNPFSEPSRAQSHVKYDFDIPSPSSGYNRIPFSFRRPLTPPPDMNTVVSSIRPSQHSCYEDKTATPVKYETGQQLKHDPVAYNQAQVFNHVQPKQEAVPRPTSRPRSPVFTQNPNTAPSRRSSQVSTIAPSLQIPRSVNNSQGSLAELAAQITCLFWFESSATLERAECPTTFNYPLQSLAPDAIPTTGFRKWVTTILSTTQVAQNVIILALLFIYRLKKLNPTVKGKPGSEYRLLTVALMLGNKFLDDNTYTNKTWAEVSGISVAEVHIMEVEFLSNMKYALFTSAEEWAKWQTQLGRFASFFEQATTRVSVSHPVATGPLGITLPSPPASNHASPPYTGVQMSIHNSQPSSVIPISHGPTPNISPLARIPELHSSGGRKRSLDHSVEPPAKRLATSSYGQSFPSATPSSTAVSAYSQSQFLPRVPLPSLAIPHLHQTPQMSQTQQQQQQQQTMPQLPPLNYPQRSFTQTHTPTSTWSQNSSITAPASRFSQTPMQMTSISHSVPQSRQQSPYPGSANVSPTNGALQPAGQAHSSQLSPSYYLQQRNSPYRPIRGVSTLLVPPPSSTTQQPQNIGREQMHYQPLGRPQERQTGQLPYIAQNQWFDGQHQSSVSAYQWPSFMSNHQQQQHAHTQLPLPLPTPTFGRV